MSEGVKSTIDELIESVRQDTDPRIKLSGLSVKELENLRSNLDAEIQKVMTEFQRRIQQKNEKLINEESDHTFDSDRRSCENKMNILSAVRDAVDEVLASVSSR